MSQNINATLDDGQAEHRTYDLYCAPYVYWNCQKSAVAVASNMGIGWSIHRNDGWQGQLALIRRWHQRVLTAAQTGSPDLQDFIFVFFQSCYHLREWLHLTSNIPKADVARFFSATRELRLCRDICNGTKHLDLSHASVDAHFSIGWEYAPQEPNGGRIFLIADDKYDLLELASQCLRLLEQFTAQDPIKPVNRPIRPGQQRGKTPNR